MAFAPNTTLYLIGGVLIDNKYQHTFRFSSQEDQLTYFQNKVFHTINDFTVMRKDQPIRVPFNLEQLGNINYCMFRNTFNGVGRWYFCFVNKKTYINEGVTELDIETDVMQTYQFDYDLKPCFVDREHKLRWNAARKPFIDYVEENLDYGTVYFKKHEVEFKDGDLYWFLVASTEPLENTNPDDGGTTEYQFVAPLQNAPTPFHFYLVPCNRYGGIVYMEGLADMQILNASDLCQLNKNTPSIVSISFIPYLPFPTTELFDPGTRQSTIMPFGDVVRPLKSVYMDNLAILKIDPFFTQDYCTRAIGTTVNCYEGVNLPTVFTKGMNRDPKYESKLYSFPYMYWMLTDYQCDPMIIKPEWLDSEDMQVMCTQSLSHQPKTKYFLGTGYMGEDNGKSNCIINSTVNDLPLTSSAYVNYIIANKAQATAGMALAVGNSALNIAVGAMTGGLGLAMTAGNMLNGFSAIAQEMAKRKDLQNIPDSVKHSGNNVSFDITDDNIHVKLIRYEIHPDFKKRLADFWAMYGYKSGEVKVPNISTRYYYNYVKTIGCVIDGDMDTEAKSKIRSIFDMGVTLWHYHAGENFKPLDYTYENIETSLL